MRGFVSGWLDVCTLRAEQLCVQPSCHLTAEGRASWTMQRVLHQQSAQSQGKLWDCWLAPKLVRPSQFLSCGPLSAACWGARSAVSSADRYAMGQGCSSPQFRQACRPRPQIWPRWGLKSLPLRSLPLNPSGRGELVEARGGNGGDGSVIWP